MLEHYFVKPNTIDEIRNCWLGEPIEQYVTWLAEKGYATRNIHSRIPILKQFAKFAWAQGARSFDELPEQVEPFVSHWMAERDSGRSAARTHDFRNEIRGPAQRQLEINMDDN